MMKRIRLLAKRALVASALAVATITIQSGAASAADIPGTNPCQAHVVALEQIDQQISVQNSQVQALELQIAAHNAQPHYFRVPQQAAQAAAYGAQAQRLNGQVGALNAWAQQLNSTKRQAVQNLQTCLEQVRAQAEAQIRAQVEAQVLENKRIGDAARDTIVARYPGARWEVTLQAKSGPRRLDVLTPQGLAIESKVGRTYLDDRTRQELARDVELLNDRNSPVKSLLWEFTKSPVTGESGPSGPLAKALDDAGIPWVVR